MRAIHKKRRTNTGNLCDVPWDETDNQPTFEKVAMQTVMLRLFVKSCERPGVCDESLGSKRALLPHALPSITTTATICVPNIGRAAFLKVSNAQQP